MKKWPSAPLVVALALAATTSMMAASAKPPRGLAQPASPRMAGPVRPVQQDPVPIRFVERPGALEFTGRLIVRPLSFEERLAQGQNQFVAGQADQAARDRLADHLVRYEHRTDEYFVQVPEGSNENLFAHELITTGDYRYVTPDWMCYPVDAPNDPFYGNQWHHQTINSEAAWALTTGDPSIIAAFVDTGVDLDHPDLAAQLVPGYNSVDRIRQVDGGDVSDINGHGTAVGGTIGAIANNNEGVAGVAWNIRLMPIRTSNASGGGASLGDITHGAMWAIENGARISSASYTGVQSPAVESAGEYIESIGGLFCYAADNYNQNHSSFDWEHVIVVGATDQGDNKAGFSSYGVAVDVFAPGVSIGTTTNGGGYGSPSGTSFSTPMTNGVLAMIWSVEPSFTNDQVRLILFNSCEDLGDPGDDWYFGHGRTDLGQAVQDAFGALGPQPPVAVNDNTSTIQDLAITIDVLANDFDVNGDEFSITAFDASSPNGGVITLSEGTGQDGRDELTFTPAASFTGNDTFTYTIMDSTGLEDSATVMVEVLDPANFRAPDMPLVTESGVRARYYALSNPEVLPDFDQLTHESEEVVNQINYPSTNGNFAGSGRNDNVGAVWTGYVEVDAAAFYTFYVNSDDGSRLYIGNQMIVDNDGLHGMQERSGEIALQPGLHAIRVEFFERGGGAGCIVSMQGGGMNKQAIPIDRWFHDPTVAAPLDDMTLLLGSVLGGGFAEILESDDAYYRVRSAAGFSVLEPSIVELLIGATSPNAQVDRIHVTIEHRINHPNGITKLRLRNWNTNAMQPVGEFPVGMTEKTDALLAIDATNRVRNDGRIDLSVKHVVLAVFSAQGFDSFFDQVRVFVD